VHLATDVVNAERAVDLQQEHAEPVGSVNHALSHYCEEKYAKDISITEVFPAKVDPTVKSSPI
jgi:hypothetical protein